MIFETPRSEVSHRDDAEMIGHDKEFGVGADPRVGGRRFDG